MRAQIHLSANSRRHPVPFNYHEKLVGAFHRWLGDNNIHDDLSLYSVSWLGPGKVRAGALDFPHGTYFYISAPSRELLADLIEGVNQGQEVAYGMQVEALTLYPTPSFGDRQLFYTQSPILIKRKEADGNRQHFYYHDDPEAGNLMTETLQRKLERLGIPTDVRVDFDRSYPRPRIKMATYRGIKNKASECPVVVQGHPDAVSAAWDVGIGNSTGIGFGALK